MKVLLYFEGQNVIGKSGIGNALKHQKRALATVGIDYTTNAACTDYDLLHINTYGPKSLLKVKQAKAAGKKVIYHAHSTEEDFKNSFVGSNQLAPLVKKWLVYLYEQADHLITPTPYARRLLKNYGIKQPIAAISNGIDLKKYYPTEEKEAAFRTYFHLQLKQKVVISVGLFFKRKGLLDFVEIARQFPDYTFIWFGEVPLYSIPRDIRQIVLHDHPQNVLFPGYISGEIIEGAYSGADLFFFPSYEETEGIVVLEALASKQQVLVRDIPVYEGWLVDQKNCYMGQTNQDFIDLITRLTKQKDLPVAQAGFKTAQSKSIQEIGLELQAVYQKVLERRYDQAIYEKVMR